MCSLQLIVVAISIDQHFHSFLINVVKCFQVFYVRKNEYSSSSHDNLIDSAIWNKKSLVPFIAYYIVYKSLTLIKFAWLCWSHDGLQCVPWNHCSTMHQTNDINDTMNIKSVAVYSISFFLSYICIDERIMWVVMQAQCSCWKKSHEKSIILLQLFSTRLQQGETGHSLICHGEHFNLQPICAQSDRWFNSRDVLWSAGEKQLA